MKKIIKFGIFILIQLFLVINSPKLLSQPENWLNGVSFELSDDKTGYGCWYIASDYIKLLPGFKYKASPNIWFRAEIDKWRLFPIDYVPQVDIVDPGSRTIDKNLPVGSIEANFTVSPTGAAICQIPIFIPPGTNGVQPSISLSYNSQTGNGIAGWGWNLTGLSLISRMPYDLFHDEKIEQFSNSVSDRLSLDGNRLFIVSGTEGTTQAIYGTEVGNVIRIMPQGVANDGTGYTWFKVITKEGTVLEYGRTEKSRIIVTYYENNQAKTCIVGWRLNKLIDVNGNYIEYKYDNDDDTGESYLQEINYTGNDIANLTPYAKIEFKYGRRKDDNVKYLSLNVNSNSFYDDVKLTESLLLRGIFVYNNNELVRKYELKFTNNNIKNEQHYPNYETHDYSYLYEVVQYGQENQRINSTIFKNKEKDNPYSSFKYTKVSPHNISGWQTGKKASFVFGEFNGDGIQDRLVIERDYNDGTNTPKACWFLQFGQYFECGDDKDCGEISYINVYNIPVLTTIDKTLDHEIDIKNIITTDLDNDGIDELILPTQQNWCTFGPFDFYKEYHIDIYKLVGDVFQNKSSMMFMTYFGTEWGIYIKRFINLQVGEFNGDKRIELIIPYKEESYEDVTFLGAHIYWKSKNREYTYIGYVNIFNGSQYIENPVVEIRRISVAPNVDVDNKLIYWQVFALPFNANEKTDIITIFKHKDKDIGKISIYEMKFNSLQGTIDFESTTLENSISYNKYTEYLWGDINGDGLVDLIKNNNLGLGYYINSGGHLSDENYLEDVVEGFISTIGSSIEIADFNGDGKADILSKYESDRKGHEFIQYQILFSIGLNHFDYQTMWQSGITNYKPYATGSNYTSFDGLSKFTYKDFNGDGSTDIYNTSDNGYIITFYPHQNYRQLISSSDGLGNLTKINYNNICKGDQVYNSTHTSSYPLKIMTSSIDVVTEIDNYLDDKITIYSKYIYSYSDALAHIDKGILGFKKNIIYSNFENNDNNYSVLTNEYELDNYNLFVLNPFKSTLSRHWRSGSTDHLDDLSITTYENSIKGFVDNERYFFYLSKVTNENILNNSKVTTDISQDDFQNITQSVISYADYSDPTAKTTIVNDYDMIGSWCDSKLVHSSLTMIHKDDPNKTFFKEKDYSYDDPNNPYLLNKTIEFPGKTQACTTDYDYDVYGNIKYSKITQSEDPNLQAREKTINYDNKGRFPIEEIDGLNYKTTKEYNEVYGRPKKVTDLNGNITNYEFDYFGRQIEVITPFSPNDLIISTNITFDDGSGPSGSLYYKEISATNAPTIKTYYNSLGWELRSEKESFNNKTIVVDNVYINDGRLQKTSFPYFKGSSTDIETEFQYDVFLRQNTVIKNGVTTKTIYDGKTITVISPYPNGKESSKEIDDLGNTVKTIEKINSSSQNEVNFKYNCKGKVKEITTVSLNNADAFSIKYDYDDEYGRLTHQDDPEAGEYYYFYNAFGEQIKQTDPKGNSEIYDFDKIGRVTKSTIKDENGTLCNQTDYSFVVANSNGSGKLEQVELRDGSQTLIHKIVNSYDSKRRISQKDEYIDNHQFTNKFYYDDYNNIFKEEYPSGVIIQYVYDTKGYMNQVKRIDNNHQDVLWELKSFNEREMILQRQMAGGKIVTDYGFDINYFPNTVNTNALNSGGDVNFQNLEYHFSATRGVLIDRIDNKNKKNGTAQSESFIYDELYRLKEYTINNSSNITISYHKDGSIDNKSDLGTYHYTYAKDDNGQTVDPPHAPKWISDDYQRALHNHTYLFNLFNKISSITDEYNNVKVEYSYGYDKQRRKVVYSENNNFSNSRYYLNNFEKTFQSDGTTQEISYIKGLGGIFAANVIKKNGSGSVISDQTIFILTDYLGSVSGLAREKTDNPGDYELFAEFSYDPWGRIRDKNNWENLYYNLPSNSDFFILGRGFTGHEHLEKFGLIEMNARLYDAFIGKFLSPDNIIPNTNSSQAYNRYSYCYNNPLSYTDPSGNFPVLEYLIVNFIFQGLQHATNPNLPGNAFQKFIRGGLVSVFSTVLGAGTSGFIDLFTSHLFGVASTGIIPGVISGAITGGVTDYMSQILARALYGISGSVKLEDLNQGIFMGAFMGGLYGAQNAEAKGRGIFFGEAEATTKSEPLKWESIVEISPDKSKNTIDELLNKMNEVANYDEEMDLYGVEVKILPKAKIKDESIGLTSYPVTSDGKGIKIAYENFKDNNFFYGNSHELNRYIVIAHEMGHANGAMRHSSYYWNLTYEGRENYATDYVNRFITLSGMNLTQIPYRFDWNWKLGFSISLFRNPYFVK